MITGKPQERKTTSILQDEFSLVQRALTLFPFAVAVTTRDFRVVYQNTAFSKKFNKSLRDLNHDKGILSMLRGSEIETELPLSLKQSGRWSGSVRVMQQSKTSHFFLSCEPMLLGTARKPGYVWSFMDNEIESDTVKWNYLQNEILLGEVTDGFFILDKTLSITAWNSKAEQKTGIPAIEVLGKSITAALPELFNGVTIKNAQRNLLEKNIFFAEKYIPRLDHWLEMNGHPFNDGMFVSFKEITKKKKQELLSELEKKVLEINSDLKSSLRKTLDIYLQGIEGVFPGLLCAVLTFNDDGMSLSHVSAPNVPEDFCFALNGITLSEGAANTLYTREKNIVTDISTSPVWKNYREIAAEFELSSCWSIPVLNGQNKVLGIFAVYCKDNRLPDETSTDLLDRAGNLVKVILENKQAEDELKIINERYILATKATNDVIWDLDLKSRKLSWSDGLYTQFGFELSDEINQLDFWERRIHPDDRSRVKSDFEKFAAQKENSRWQEEYRFKIANGKFIWIADRGFLMYNKEGNAVRVIGSMQDISLKRELGKKILKQELDKQKLIVQAVVDAQEKERADIGKELHDNVNQILSTTKLYLEMAKNREEERMDLIERSMKNIHHAIDEIRNISRSLVPPSIGDLGLVAAIKDLVENVKAFKAIHVEFFAVGPIEKTISDQQKLMLFRIIQEQVNNVLKHSETKNLVIELILLKSENQVELNITDDGKGFEPLNIKHKKGLGLSNIASRASLFGGRVSIVSAAGQGCKLTVQVPVSNL